MNTRNRTSLAPEDYVEPRCLLCDEPYGKTPEVKSIPQQRIIQKMDAYMSRRDYAGAERHLQYWLEEARLGHDERGELLIHNELIGHYRKVGNREAALRNVEDALALLKKLDFEHTVSGGTTYVNAATACNAFGENERAMELFEKARAVYEAGEAHGTGETYREEETDRTTISGMPTARTSPALLGGLYNNMALTCVCLGRFEEAKEFYHKALEKMRQVPGGELEQAITYLNMADAAVAKEGMEQSESRVYEYLDRAYELLTGTEAPRDGYYAFVCEKCAPVFDHYGYFAAAQELMECSRRIYEQGSGN